MTSITCLAELADISESLCHLQVPDRSEFKIYFQILPVTDEDCPVAPGTCTWGLPCILFLIWLFQNWRSLPEVDPLGAVTCFNADRRMLASP